MDNTTGRRHQITEERELHYRGRWGQISIYLGKLIRSFIYMSDWKVLPMAAVIAGLVSLVVRRNFFVTMEGTIAGSFAMTCVAIWNGCFNSIQSVVRERPIIKREHRSGLHITSYIFSHMIYQAALCLAQTGVTLYVCAQMQIKFPAEGFMTPYMIVDLGISMFMISYAADMISLFISSVSHTTTGAMTVMPFLLIFQLVFSGGGFFVLPAWAEPFSLFTISSYGLRCINAQADYNNLPLVATWNSVETFGGRDIPVTISVGQVLEKLQREDIEGIRHLRESILGSRMTLSTAIDLIKSTPEYDKMKDMEFQTELDGYPETMTIGELVGLLEKEGDEVIYDSEMTVGEIIDTIAESKDVMEHRDDSVTMHFKLDDLIDLIGRDKVRDTLNRETAASQKKDIYERSVDNIVNNWMALLGIAFAAALLSIIALEFIDKDKR